MKKVVRAGIIVVLDEKNPQSCWTGTVVPARWTSGSASMKRAQFAARKDHCVPTSRWGNMR